MLTTSGLIKNKPCWEKRKVQTSLLKDSPRSLPVENFNLPPERRVAQHVCVLHPEAQGKLAPTVQLSKMVSVL